MAELDGILVVDKPSELTSFDVVRAVRRSLRTKRVGHTGTLDPLATGVLPVCVGEATKIAGLLLAEDKVYLATALLGKETDSHDITGQVVAERDASGISREQVEAALAGLRGEQQQVPPAFSAIRKDGVRSYKRARRGEEVELPPRQVTVLSLELTRWELPCLDLQIECSKGTYVRSLVRALGRALGCGATLSALRRLRSGSFDLSSSLRLDELEERGKRGELPLISMDAALGHLEAVELEPEQVARVRQGQPVDVSPPADEGEPPSGERLIRVRCQGALVALGVRRAGRVWPKRVFAAAP